MKHPTRLLGAALLLTLLVLIPFRPTVHANPAATAAGVAAGEAHTCAIVDGGTKCWGSDADGQLGNGAATTGDQLLPTAVTGLSSGASQIATGHNSEHSCAIVSGGVKCWGDDEFGQLGNGNGAGQAEDKVDPIDVTNLGPGSNVSQVAVGGEFTCALRSGEVYCWGSDDDGQMGNGDIGNDDKVDDPIYAPELGSPVAVPGTVNKIAAGFDHVCALNTNGAAFCWGGDATGQIGNGTDPDEDNQTPQAVTGLGSGVTDISAGGRHTCAVVNGGVKCWGENVFGQLGTNNNDDSDVPVDVFGLGAGSGATAVAAGDSHTCAIVNQRAQCWGFNADGQLGNSQKSGVYEEFNNPVAVNLSADIDVISAGFAHTCAITTGATLYCWGLDEDGQLGNGAPTEDEPTPALVNFSGLVLNNFIYLPLVQR